MDYIPPETLIGFVVTAFTLFFAGLGGAGYLFRKWFLDRLDTERKRTEQDIQTAKSKVDIDRLEIQNQLDQTQSSRQMAHLLVSENAETRKAFLQQIEAMRQDAKTRDALYEKHLTETAESYRGIQGNTAATFGLLKEMVDKLSKHQESDETMEAQQGKIIAQNSTTHDRMADINSLLVQIALELKGITANCVGDRDILNDIQSKLGKLQEAIATIEEIARTPPSVTEVPATPVTNEDKPSI